MSFIDIALH